MMKKICLLLIVITLLSFGCNGEDEKSCDCPVLSYRDFNFEVKNSVADSIVVNTLDKIVPKPTFYEKQKKIAQGKLKLTIPKNSNFIKLLDFNPIIADKERILELKIYKNNEILVTKRISYTAVAYRRLYEKDEGNKKPGDVLSLHEITVHSDIKVKIDNVKTGHIKLDGLAIFINNDNIIF